jgi:hypothetical protein
MKTKMKNLSNKQEKETDILAKRILPKTDFLKVIEHDKLYYNTLKEALDFNIIKRDILTKETEKVLKNQTEEIIIENIPLLTEWADTKLKTLDLQGKLRVQQTLVDDKIMHFDNVFMPQFEKEVKDSKENFDKTIKKANEIVKLNEDFAKEIIDKINYELVWWSKVDATNKKNEEYVLQIYKPLKRLVSKYNEKKDGK